MQSRTCFLYVSFLIAAAACRPVPDRDSQRDTFSEFNKFASKQLVASFDSIDLYPMSHRERCIMKNVISQYLDSFNSYRLVQLDSFFIRNYYVTDLGLNMSIVKAHQRFYLIVLPKLYEYFYTDHYYRFRGADYELSKPEFAVAYVNSDLLNTFIRKEVFRDDGNSMQFERAKALLIEVFPELTRNEVADASELLNWIHEQPPKNRDVIQAFFRKIMERKPILSYTQDWVAYKISYLGYVIFDFKLVGNVAPRIAVDVFFIPYTHRFGMGYEVDEKKFENCYP